MSVRTEHDRIGDLIEDADWHFTNNRFAEAALMLRQAADHCALLATRQEKAQ